MTDEEDQRERRKPGRRDYDNLAKKVSDYTANTERRLRRFIIGALIAFAIIGLATTASLIGFGIVLNNQQETADQLKQLVKQNQAFAKQNQAFAKAIQDQRADSIRRNCNQQNGRNEATKLALKEGSDVDQANAPNAAAREEIRRRRDVTFALIDAIAPTEDCEEAVRKAVKGG